MNSALIGAGGERETSDGKEREERGERGTLPPSRTLTRSHKRRGLLTPTSLQQTRKGVDCPPLLSTA